MSQEAWMSQAVKLFDITFKLLQQYLEAQKELEKLWSELTTIQKKFDVLEREYGYDTVRWAGFFVTSIWYNQVWVVSHFYACFSFGSHVYNQ